MNTSYNPFSLEGKMILVTGASSGIGRQTAIRISEAGATVIIVARRREELEKVASECPNEVQIICADLTVETDIENLLKNIPVLDGVVLCAGKGLSLPVQFCSREKFNGIFDVNLFSTVELLRLLYKKKKIVKGGSMVAVTSIGGLHVFSGGNAIYGASKAALDSFLKFSAREFAARGIRVNSVRPGMIDTPLIHRGAITDEQLEEDAKRYPLKRYGKPDDVAYGIIYLLSDASSWVTGTSLVIDGGVSV